MSELIEGRVYIDGYFRRDIGLGSVHLVALAEAREHAAALRKIARRGGDPLAERRRALMVVPTFNDAALNAQLVKAWGELREPAADKRALIAKLKTQLTPETLAKAD